MTLGLGACGFTLARSPTSSSPARTVSQFHPPTKHPHHSTQKQTPVPGLPPLTLTITSRSGRRPPQVEPDHHLHLLPPWLPPSSLLRAMNHSRRAWSSWPRHYSAYRTHIQTCSPPSTWPYRLQVRVVLRPRHPSPLHPALRLELPHLPLLHPLGPVQLSHRLRGRRRYVRHRRL